QSGFQATQFVSETPTLRRLIRRVGILADDITVFAEPIGKFSPEEMIPKEIPRSARNDTLCHSEPKARNLICVATPFA
ncbi:MAG: hypothetical protein NZ843_04670, partial [Fimbriimonadales bacterium]|nr:hypothetical protein [Fimbriimonadales bacterium]